MLTPMTDMTTAYNKFFTQLYVYVYKFLKNHMEAEDVVIEVFQKLFESNKIFRDIDHMTNWLYCGCKNGAFNILRKRKSDGKHHKKILITLEESEEMDDNDILDEMLSQRIVEMVEKLSHRAKEVIQYLYFEKMSYAEVAEKMKISIKTVDITRLNAIKKIRENFNWNKVVSESES